MKPLAVYIHWPFCKSKCPYCDFNSHVRDAVDTTRWQQALLAELRHMADLTKERRVLSLFFGGGTPSLMPPSIAGALINEVHRLWPVAADMEITLEANPTSVEAQKLRDFKAAGINRVSLGVQSLAPADLAFLGREHSEGEARAAIALARDIFDRTSFDLIYARPNQTPAQWERELRDALTLAGDHLSLYQLTIENGTAFYHAYAKGGFVMPTDEESETLYRLTEDMMQAHGLPAYEVSNYARPGRESRHNLAYWKGYDYAGVGPGAHGRLTLSLPVFSAENTMEHGSGPVRPAGLTSRIATATLKSPERWLEAVERSGHAIETWQTLEAGPEVQERLMMGLRLREGIDYAAFAALAGFDLRNHIDMARVTFFQHKGLLEPHEQRLAATLAGRLVLNTLTAELLA
jgi:putative oxygen-independent coproporphyrinogen III oxidase